VGNIFNKNFIEFIDCLNQSSVQYILVGGYSVILHGYPRTTGDLDIWVNRVETNYEKLEEAFVNFGLPTFDMTLANFLNTARYDVFRFGRPPLAIDIITDLKGIDFETAWKGKVMNNFDGIDINYLNYHDLIVAKKAAGRPRDINDIDNLEKIN
jgi:Nucleotidyltransferase of unknown function (DUF6036)